MVEEHGVPRRLSLTVVTVDAGPAVRVRFHALVVRAHRDWESGTRDPNWLRCSTNRPGVVAPQE
jgi:hypothetical protein